MGLHITVIEGPDRGLHVDLDGRPACIVGRSESAHLRPAGDPNVSRFHFAVEATASDLLLVDLGSSNGTFLNDVDMLVKEARVAPGDVIRAGLTLFALQSDAQVRAAPTLRPTRRLACAGCRRTTMDVLPRDEVRGAAGLCATCHASLLKQPRLLPDYQVVRELGRGSMGVVYQALHRSLGYPRAIKVLLPEVDLTDEIRAGILREANVQIALSHPNIVRMFDLHEPDDGLLCIVMEYVAGDGADRVLQRSGGRLATARAVHIVAEALLGLAHLHGRGIVHRDVKASNLLVVPGAGGLPERVKLADFGLAKCFETAGHSGFTRSRFTAGTPRFMAPEQIFDYRRAGPAADLYAAGVTLYHLLSGEFPIDVASDESSLLASVHAPITPLRSHVPSLSESLAQAVERALSKSPDDRFPSALDMRDALLAAI